MNAGEDIGFTITVTNNGPGIAHDVTLSDTLPTGAGLSWSEDPDNPDCQIAAGKLSCAFGELGDDESVSVHISSPTTFASCGEIKNVAKADADNTDEVTADDTVTVQCPDSSLTKEADDATVSAGEQIGFTITVSQRRAGHGQGRHDQRSAALRAPASTGRSPAARRTARSRAPPSGDAALHRGRPRRRRRRSACTSSRHDVRVVQGVREQGERVTASNHATLKASDSTTVECPDLEI